MDSLHQLWPLVRPHRRALVMAVSCASLAAALWAAALFLAFPITKVLLEQQSLEAYVEQEIAQAHLEIDKAQRRIADLDAEQGNPVAPGSVAESPDIERLQNRARLQDGLSRSIRREWSLVLVRQHILPLFPRDRFDTLAMLLVGLVLITALHGATVYLQEVWIGRVVQLSMRSLRARLFRQTLKLDPHTLANDGSGALMSRFTNDLTSIAQGMTLLGGKIVLEPLKAGFCLGAAFLYNWRLTLLSMLCAPLGALLFQRFGKQLKRASRRQMETVARLYGVIQETLSAFPVVVAFGRQRHHRLRLYAENRSYYRRAMQINRIDALANPTVELLGVFAACLAILPGAYLVMRQKTGIWGLQLTADVMDLASLATLYALLAGVLDPARKLSSAFSRLKKSVAACERVMSWIDQRGHASGPIAGDDDIGHGESLTFEEVTYCYPKRDGTGSEPALNRVSLEIAFGETIAIVGSNGSGKSTLAGLIPRFQDPQTGRVLLDGRDIATVSPRRLRELIGWVPQEPMLFDRSIAANIALGSSRATLEQIEDVSRQTFVTDFASAWDDGLQTMIGDSGNRLSGGQRQRIALARALLRNPPLLILDEATSAIDAQSENLIYRTLRQGASKRTTLIITHTLTATLLGFVSRIAFLDRGRLIAVGTHAELMASCPPYAELYLAQSARRAA